MGTVRRKPEGSWIDQEEAFDQIIRGWKVIGHYGQADWTVVLDARTRLADIVKCHSYEITNARLDPKMLVNKSYIHDGCMLRKKRKENEEQKN